MTDREIARAVGTGRLHRVFRSAYAIGHPHASPRGRLLAATFACGKGAFISHRSAAALLGLLDKGPAVIDVIPASEADRGLDGSGTAGNPSLRELIDEWRKAAPVARKGKLKSPLEAKVLPLLVRRELPPPRLNAPVEIANGRIEVDFLWPDHRFVVEADSRDFHGTDLAFERDRWRDRELFAVGYSTLRVTHHQAVYEAEAVANAIAARLR